MTSNLRILVLATLDAFRGSSASPRGILRMLPRVATRGRVGLGGGSISISDVEMELRSLAADDLVDKDPDTGKWELTDDGLEKLEGLFPPRTSGVSRYYDEGPQAVPWPVRHRLD